MNQTKEKVHFYWLDLIRFIAALAVVIVHTRCEVWETYRLLDEQSKNPITILLYAILSQGGAGVIMFFALSGFLVGGRTIERIVLGTVNLRQYIIDRSVRIGLPLIGSLILIICVDCFIGQKPDFITLFGNLFALQGILVDDAGGVFWTLSYEMWFYVLIGALIVVFMRSNVLKLYGGIILLLSLCAFTALKTNLLFVLLFGVLAYYWCKQEWKESNALLKGAVFCFCVCMLLSNLAADSHAFDKSAFTFLSSDVINTCLGFCSALIIMDVSKRKPTTKLQTFFDSWGTKLAQFSYSLYLTHF